MPFLNRAAKLAAEAQNQFLTNVAVVGGLLYAAVA